MDMFVKAGERGLKANSEDDWLSEPVAAR